MTRIAAQLIAVFVGIVIIVNAGMMLVSPRAWFHLPRWIRMKGTLAAERYQDGWGAIQIRIVGAVVLGVIAWCIYFTFHG